MMTPEQSRAFAEARDKEFKLQVARAEYLRALHELDDSLRGPFLPVLLRPQAG